MTDVVGKLWGFCHVLRHDGIDYGDYIEQITYLLFLKMADERGITLPKDYNWKILKDKSGTDLIDYYDELLKKLAKSDGLLGDIFVSAKSKFSTAVNLKKLIGLIDEIDWTSLNVDVKAQAYEGLLEKAASEGKKGAGQYFTPRILIQAIVRCMKPDPRGTSDFTICDPAAGTGGFLMCSYEWLMEETKGALKREEVDRIKKKTYYGTELVERPRRLCLMNLYLHGLEANITLGDSIYHPPTDKRYDVIVTNPPFGTKGANQAPDRDDFTIETSNKQLNFIQHVLTILKPGGRAAIVVPDNCFYGKAAGEVFKILMDDCNLHTILRLPDGTFTPYSPGLNANVIFFQKGLPTEITWIYDCRTNIPSFTKKERPLSSIVFKDFEKCYQSETNAKSKRYETDRFKKITISEVKSRGYNLDIFWLEDEESLKTKNLPQPEALINDLICRLNTTLTEFQNIDGLLKSYK